MIIATLLKIFLVIFLFRISKLLILLCVVIFLELNKTRLLKVADIPITV